MKSTWSPKIYVKWNKINLLILLFFTFNIIVQIVFRFSGIKKIVNVFFFQSKITVLGIFMYIYFSNARYNHMRLILILNRIHNIAFHLNSLFKLNNKGWFTIRTIIHYILGSSRKALFFYHDFGYSFPLFSSLVIKERRRKGECITKVVVNKQCLSARSYSGLWIRALSQYRGCVLYWSGLEP